MPEHQHNSRKKHPSANKGIKVKVNGEKKALGPEKKEVAAVEQYGPLNWESSFKQPEAEPKHLEAASMKALNKGMNKRKNSNIFIKTFWIPLLSAIIVGLGLGLTVLIMFSDAKTTTTSPQTKTQNSTQDTEPTTSPPADLPVNKLSMDVSVIQYGAFSTKEKAKVRQNKLSDVGIPSIAITGDSLTRVYIGVAEEKGLANAIATNYNELSSKPYVQKWSIEANAGSVTSEPLYQDLQTAKQLLQNLLTVTSNGSGGDVNVNSLSKQFQGWNVSSSKGDHQQIQTLHDVIGATINAASQQEPKTKAIQQLLLEALSEYQKIIK